MCYITLKFTVIGKCRGPHWSKATNLISLQISRVPVPKRLKRSKPNLARWSKPSTDGLHLCAKFHLDRLIVTPSRGEKNRILSYFQLRRYTAAPPSVLECTTRNLPYPTVQKPFSNAFMTVVFKLSLLKA